MALAAKTEAQAETARSALAAGKRLLALGIERREGVLVLSFSGVSVVAGLVGNRLLTGYVDPRPLGELYLLMNLAHWLTVPTASGYVYVQRHWQEATAHGAGRWLARWLGRGLALQAAIAALGALLLHLIGVGLTTWPLAGLLLVVCASQATSQILDSIQTMERRRWAAGFLQLLGTPSRPFALLLGALLIGCSGVGLFATQAVYSAVLAGVSVLAFLLVLRGAPRESSSAPEALAASGLTIGTFIALSAPSLLSNAMTQGAASAERWGLALHADPAQTALFVQAVGLAMSVVGAATGFLGIYFAPLFTGAAVGQARPIHAAARPLRRFLLSTMAALGLVVVAFTLLAHPITRLFFGARFQAVEPLLPWTIAGAALFQLGQTLFYVPYLARETVSQMVTYTGSRIVYIALLLGLAGSGASALRFTQFYVIGHILYAVAMAWVAWRHVRREGQQPLADPGARASASVPL